MLIYNLNLALIAVWGAIFCIYKPNKIKKAAFLLLSYSQMAILLIYRVGIGYDYIAYQNMFVSNIGMSPESYADSFKNAMANDIADVCEPGYYVFCKLVGKITQDPNMFYLIVAVLLMAAVAIFLFFYSKMPVVSTILFVCLTFYYSMFSQIRQVLAMVIVLYAWPFLKKRKLIPYMLIVLLAVSFHFTAVIMIPVYFICNMRPTVKVLAIYASVMTVVYFCIGYLLEFVTEHVYSVYTSESIYMQSMSTAYIILPALIMIAAIIFKDRLIGANGANCILINMSIYSFAIWMLITKHLLLERLSWYPYIFVILLLPELIMSFAPTEKMIAHRNELINEGIAEKGGVGALANIDGTVKVNAIKPDGKDGKREKRVRSYGGKRKAVAEIEKKIKEANIKKWIAIGAVILGAYAYNVFGMYDGDFGFHGIFPYATSNEVLSKVPGTMHVNEGYDRFARFR